MPSLEIKLTASGNDLPGAISEAKEIAKAINRTVVLSLYEMVNISIHIDSNIYDLCEIARLELVLFKANKK